ncbi:MAG TPA: glycosyltransferase family 87 protein [Caulobacteraceae bacterium]|jgi:hypothetical protein|nr:glycosyltransferase family 87 protein [Caulobacteraceae bacterium]
MPSCDTVLAFLRDATWFDRQRARAYSLIFAVVALIAGLGWVAASHGGLDPLGKPLGTDFTSFWAASKLALSGRPLSVYDLPAHAALERSIFGGADVGYSAFFYPPVFLLICLPLALLPYLASLAAWLGATGYAYWRVARAAWGKTTGLTLPVLAFPAVLINIGHGQNGFLTAALMGGGALMMRGRPILAGLCFGALIFKPHLGLLIPVALLASGRWKSIFAAAGAVLALVAASILAFGLDVWRGFLAVSPMARAALEQNLVGNEKMQSVFAAVRLWRGPLALAYGGQAVVAVGAAWLLVRLARKGEDPDALGPALIAAALLASPFLLDYDLILLAVPLAWVLGRAERTGFLPWEKLVLSAGFLLPLVSRALAAHFGLPLGPPVVLAVLMVVVRRGFATQGNLALTRSGLALAA